MRLVECQNTAFITFKPELCNCCMNQKKKKTVTGMNKENLSIMWKGERFMLQVRQQKELGKLE